MARTAVRFRPPRVVISPALAWVLSRAFGPLPQGAPPGPGEAGDPRQLHALARRLGLSPRIASRLSRQGLERELGPEVAEGFLHDRFTATAADLSWSAVAGELAAAAAAAPLSLIFLKYLALRFAGAVEEGSRTAADCDVLVPAERCEELAEALVTRGFRRAGTRAFEHQLPPLYHPTGAPVEIHRLLLGVRLGGRRSATAADLEAAGLLVAVDGLPGPCFRPSREVLAAHALVHGIAQHGWAPHAYPALRMVADLLDLGLGGEEGEGLAARFAPWVARALTRGEVEAARRLAVRLGAGDPSLLTAAPGESGEAALLHHLLAGILDDDYRASLRFPMLTRPLSDLPRPLSALLSLGRTLVPGRAEMEVLDGRREARGGRRKASLGTYLARPFRLLSRAFRYARSRLAVHRRRPRGR